jgi:hypothetical protein
MSLRTRLFKNLLLVLCSGVLLGLSCPPIVVSSVKGGITSWVSGSFDGSGVSQLSDFFLSTLGGGTGTN